MWLELVLGFWEGGENFYFLFRKKLGGWLDVCGGGGVGVFFDGREVEMNVVCCMLSGGSCGVEFRIFEVRGFW